MMSIDNFYHILLVLGDYFILGRFNLGDEILDVLQVDTNFQDVDLMIIWGYIWSNLVQSVEVCSVFYLILCGDTMMENRHHC